MVESLSPQFSVDEFTGRKRRRPRRMVTGPNGYGTIGPMTLIPKLADPMTDEPCSASVMLPDPDATVVLKSNAETSL